MPLQSLINRSTRRFRDYVTLRQTTMDRPTSPPELSTSSTRKRASDDMDLDPYTENNTPMQKKRYTSPVAKPSKKGNTKTRVTEQSTSSGEHKSYLPSSSRDPLLPTFTSDSAHQLSSLIRHTTSTPGKETPTKFFFNPETDAFVPLTEEEVDFLHSMRSAAAGGVTPTNLHDIHTMLEVGELTRKSYSQANKIETLEEDLEDFALHVRLYKTERDKSKLESDKYKEQSDQYKQESDKYKQESEKYKQAKLDMMLEILRKNESYSDMETHLNKRLKKMEADRDLQRELARDLKTQLEVQKGAANNLRSMNSHMSTRQAILESEKAQYKAEAENLADKNAMLEDDIDQLRQLDIEANEARQQKYLLPPHYDEIDEDNVQPPYEAYDDGGPYDIAVMSKAVRQRFDVDVDHAYDLCDILRAQNDESMASANTRLFYELSLAMRETCSRLREAMKYAADSRLTVDSRYKISYCSRLDSDGELGKGFTSQVVTTTPATLASSALRVARLALDCGWRIVSACELRPGTHPLLSERENALASEYHKEIDDVMLEALRCAFSGVGSGVPPTHREYHFQHWLTSLENVAASLDGPGWKLRYNFFKESQAWLQEQVEGARAAAATAVA